MFNPNQPINPLRELEKHEERELRKAARRHQCPQHVATYSFWQITEPSAQDIEDSEIPAFPN